ncbi:AEC family transporter [Acetohalobium arabaticum]|uniref:Auxin Efflux Carrier n=1 Tax=Acetohalobium arabaticum (strain ATCC 49924 / DSM 5501 / Z-7288) TaxID=574087 RepID=D9QVV3_ACEAZ|nr:AEC family transporter [Acetohalobium arabaticum]ADL12362.1 Auxin Efflux Carrier [Acetohalobium arabaticum DSM 5501]
MQFSIIINQILVLFIIIFIGYIIRKKEIINQEVSDGLTDLLMEVTLPALIISSMIIEINPRLVNNLQISFWVWGGLYLFIIGMISLLSHYLPFSQNQKSVFKFATIFGNVGYMGYPVIDAIYPEYGMLYAIIGNIFFNVLAWTYGIYLFTKKEDGDNKIQFEKLLNNGLIAIIIGFGFLLTGYQLPNPLTGALDRLGNMTFPLSMIVIGSSLTNIDFKTILYNKYLYLISGLKLIIIPLIIFLLLQPFTIPTKINNIVVILFAMPSAATTVVFAEKFGADYTLASEGVFVTTLFSLVTIPFFIYLITL